MIDNVLYHTLKGGGVQWVGRGENKKQAMTKN